MCFYKIGSLPDDLVALISSKLVEGVKITIIVEDKNIPLEIKEHIGNENFSLFFHRYLHSKLVLGSSRWLLTTANLDTRYGLQNNVEVGYSSTSKVQYDALSSIFEKYLAKATEITS
jgi:phosphatidylserine/phosphatidylglycerophosphate/cardiolipin synthase-like enzyme